LRLSLRNVASEGASSNKRKGGGDAGQQPQMLKMTTWPVSADKNSESTHAAALMRTLLNNPRRRIIALAPRRRPDSGGVDGVHEAGDRIGPAEAVEHVWQYQRIGKTAYAKPDRRAIARTMISRAGCKYDGWNAFVGIRENPKLAKVIGPGWCLLPLNPDQVR